jgi:glycosyltransferase involved in cell wall biosynthesis
MFISVIITAYNRKNYILDAINSALNQTLTKDKFEVIVVTNFYDKKITELQNDLKIKHLYLQDGTIGKFILEGLNISSGDIITFLDDDDLYDSKRLDTVYKLFNNFPEVNYYKSSNIMIDSSGRILPGMRRKQSCHGGFYSKKKLLEKGNLQRLQFNLSCSTVRKEVLNSFTQLLLQMSGGTDIMLYYMAMAYGGIMYLDCTPLTYYRIHNLQTTGINNKLNHFLEGYMSTYELEKKIRDIDIKNDLEKTRVRMLFLSLSRGYDVSIKQLLNNFIFYLKHFNFNTRDSKVLIYSLFAIISHMVFKRDANSIISKLTLWINKSELL